MPPLDRRSRLPIRARRLLMPALIALALTWPASAWAYCRTTTCKGATCQLNDQGCATTGKALWWRGGCIGFTVEAAGSRLIPKDKLVDAVRKSFHAWVGVDCGGGQTASVTFGEIGQTACSEAGYRGDGPNVNVVVFQDDDWKFKESNNVAKTTVHYDPETGEIWDADIEVNTGQNLFTTDDKKVLADSAKQMLDLQTVLTHEIGHFLGLAHSDDYDSVMHADYKQGTLDGRKLTADDVAGLCAIYPPGRAVTCDLTPKGGLDECKAEGDAACSARAAGGPSNPAGSLAVLAVSLAGLAAGRVRATRPAARPSRGYTSRSTSRNDESFDRGAA